MYFPRFPNINCYRRPCQNHCHPGVNECPSTDCKETNCPPPCKPNCPPVSCHEPRCGTIYNEVDYQVDAIHQLFDEYCQIERKADAHFNHALTKLCEVMEEIEAGLACNREGREVWFRMEKWLIRYYERFGTYCGCLERMEEFKECVKKLLFLEWASLETTRFAHKQLEESRTLDKHLYVLRKEFHEHCIPKC